MMAIVLAVELEIELRHKCLMEGNMLHQLIRKADDPPRKQVELVLRTTRKQV